MPYSAAIQMSFTVSYTTCIGILKKSSPSLEPVPEFAESHEIQRADSNLEIVESEVCGIIFKGMCSLFMYVFQLFQQI